MQTEHGCGMHLLSVPVRARDGLVGGPLTGDCPQECADLMYELGGLATTLLGSLKLHRIWGLVLLMRLYSPPPQNKHCFSRKRHCSLNLLSLTTFLKCLQNMELPKTNT